MSRLRCFLSFLLLHTHGISDIGGVLEFREYGVVLGMGVGRFWGGWNGGMDHICS